MAVSKIYDFIWDSYCDWYIELTKTRLQSDDPAAKEDAQRVLNWVLCRILKLLHPFMPFITEEIWQALPHEDSALIAAAWPEWEPAHCFDAEEAEMERIMAAIKAVRALRAEKNVPPSKRPSLTVATEKTESFLDGVPFLKKLAGAGEVRISREAPENTDGMAVAITEDARIFIPLAELVDVEAELKRIKKDLTKAEGDLERMEQKLSNQAFLAKAPENVVAAERERGEKLKALVENLRGSLQQLEALK